MINLESHNVSPPPPSSEKLGKRWMEYQGMNNWEGLLDPLDDNLRAEILRYGHFVDAAYKSFEFNPSSPSYASCRFPNTTLLDKCGLPNTGYKVTKQLHATSGIQLHPWVKNNCNVPTWVSTQSSYIGYVAVCDNKEEIKRLGRRDVVVAYRGTTTCFEWLENLRATLTHLPIPCKRGFKKGITWELEDQSGSPPPMVESGFLGLYTSPCNFEPSLQHMVRQEIARILQTYGGSEPLSFTLIGHSLGAALAILTAYDISTVFTRLPTVTVISFGGPRVGNRGFRRRLEKKGTKVLRVVNSDDVVTKMPGFVFHDGHVATRRSVHVEGVPGWIRKIVEKEGWLYAEVGEELRLSSRDSPYLNGANVATCHELNTYLHLVDGFISSKCPFRATAKRFLLR
ncbi:Fungal lipase-like domain [Sesbania bispinosa]|nr:Fungal lipase-like domain [Sesbania bispinosa]